MCAIAQSKFARNFLFHRSKSAPSHSAIMRTLILNKLTASVSDQAWDALFWNEVDRPDGGSGRRVARSFETSKDHRGRVLGHAPRRRGHRLQPARQRPAVVPAGRPVRHRRRAAAPRARRPPPPTRRPRPRHPPPCRAPLLRRRRRAPPPPRPARPASDHGHLAPGRRHADHPRRVRADAHRYGPEPGADPEPAEPGRASPPSVPTPGRSTAPRARPSSGRGSSRRR